MIYAIHRETKEHRVVTSNGLICEKEWYAAHGWLLTHADADGWIPWDGGECCPLPEGADYEVRHKDGEAMPKREAETYKDQWLGKGLLSDIIAYRPILDADEQAKPEAPEWAIGSRCLWRLGDVCMGEHTILAKDGDTFWIRDDLGGYDMADREELRPIRTPAQRAEEEAVEEMIRTAGLDNEEYNRGVCRDLYRAGYHKGQPT